MTTTLERPALDLGRHRSLLDHAPVALAALVVAMRLPYAGAAPSSDESGFLMVARQWHLGTSLYGSYWVDRPPLLVAIFRVAALLGGVVPLRVIGAAAAALVVLGAARVAGQVAGRTASSWAAVIAAALCISPLMGATAVNGELLAAPFVVWGVAGFVAALRSTEPLQTRARWVALAGAGFAAAALVKQNFVDVGVFALATLLVSVVRREVTVGRAVRLGVGFAAGAVTCVVAMAGWTVLHGTSLVAVYDAMYPFRIAAARAMAASGNTAPAARFGTLVDLFLLTLVPLLMAVCAVAIGRRRVGDTVVWGLVAMTAFDLVSIYASGNYWSHYLVQLVVPVAIVGGVVAGSRQAGARLAVAAVVLSAVVGWVVVPPSASSEGTSVGRAIAAVADPSDTIVTIYGHAEVSQSSGLASPYPYLWSLPLKVRDPQLDLLQQTLSGPDAPTWLVTWSGTSSVGVDATGLAEVVADDYRPVAVLDGHTVYLRDGTGRAAPVLPKESR